MLIKLEKLENKAAYNLVTQDTGYFMGDNDIKSTGKVFDEMPGWVWCLME